MAEAEGTGWPPPGFAESDRLIEVTLDDADLPAPTSEMQQERKVALFDLLENNAFALPPRGDREAPAGPYRLHLAMRERRLVFDITTRDREKVAEFHLSLTPFRPVVKDYFQICDAYFDAVRNLPPSRIEAIDMGRRGIHDEGARLVMERLEGKIRMDRMTARRLFTLICALAGRH